MAPVDRTLAAWKVLKRCRAQGLLAGKQEAFPPARAPRGLAGAIAPALRAAGAPGAKAPGQYPTRPWRALACVVIA
ncbi:MAG: hypothetical protein ACOVME_09560 [Rhodobacter sp.]